MEKTNFLRLTARLEDLEVIRQFIELHARQAGFDASKIYDLQLAVTEMVTNTLMHGYATQCGLVEIVTIERPGDFEILIRDWAPEFDPTGVADPDFTSPLEERRLGGIGVYLTRQAADEFKYHLLPGGGNEISLVFWLS